MKVIERLNQAEKPLFTFELLPPPKGADITKLYDSIGKLIEFNPAYVNITYHQQEEVFKKRPDGLLEKQIVRKRPGTVAISAAIKYKYGVDVVPHIICGGFTKEETENALIDLNFLGIKNLLVLRGDPPKNQRYFTPETGGHQYAIDLLKQIVNLNEGRYLDETIQNSSATDFCVGVAGYPEKHIEAPNMKTDLQHLKEKVDAGADYVVTQMFFDNQKYFDFVENCRNIGIEVPIIPGMKPITTLSDVKLLPKVFSIDIPEDLSCELDKCKTNEDAWQVGIEWSVKQSKQLVEFGVPSLHYYTIGRADNIREIAKNIF
ncbi:MAG: methylenetetrahydrofolate reductase [NAD(P)H] [Marinilabiliales bacterium]|nr:MAG: methylenetetrahydrofolate reductase [NAD(P)H] [Marinilabiliales bacterium]